MTAHEAAHMILTELRRPLSSRELAEIALRRGLVSSSSRDPVQSISTTLDKNIREDRYNDPRLIFIYGQGGRKIGLPSMEGESPAKPTVSTRRGKAISVTIPTELFDQIQLAAQARIADTFEGTIVYLLKRGLSTTVPDIKDRLLSQLRELENQDKPTLAMASKTSPQREREIRPHGALRSNSTKVGKLSTSARKPRDVKLERDLKNSLGNSLRGNWGDFHLKGQSRLIFPEAEKTVLGKFSGFRKKQSHWFWGVSKTDWTTWGAQDFLALIMESEDGQGYSYLLLNSSESKTLFAKCSEGKDDGAKKIHLNKRNGDLYFQEWPEFDVKRHLKLLPKQQQDDEREDWLYLSSRGLERAYDGDEVEYPTELIKEPNPDYEGR